MKSGNLNFMEPSGPLQACNGIALPFYPGHGHHGNVSLQGKIPMVEPGIERGTSWLVVRDPEH